MINETPVAIRFSLAEENQFGWVEQLKTDPRRGVDELLYFVAARARMRGYAGEAADD